MSLIIHGKIIGDDPFPNGNKTDRTGTAMLVFFDENGIDSRPTKTICSASFCLLRSIGSCPEVPMTLLIEK